MPVQRLQAQDLEVTAYFMNPNIHPLSEYLRRREGMVQVAATLGIDVIWADNSWDIQRWLHEVAAAGVNAPARCTYCYTSRLQATCKAAQEQGFSAFSTSLLYSRYQAHENIATLGKAYANAAGMTFVYEDFRTDWQQGIDISKEWNIYRQPYCGCIYSEAERYMKSLRKLF